MSDSDHEQLADELEHEAQRLEQHSRELQEQAENARADWERKRADPAVPGAPAPAGEEEPDETQTPPW